MLVRDAAPSDAEAWRAIVLEAAREASQIVTVPEEVWSAEELAKRIAELPPARTAFPWRSATGASWASSGFREATASPARTRRSSG